MRLTEVAVTSITKQTGCGASILCFSRFTNPWASFPIMRVPICGAYFDGLSTGWAKAISVMSNC